MKTNTFFFSTTILFMVIVFSIFSSCKKDDSFTERVIIFEPGPQPNGWVTAVKNGKDFEGSAYARRHSDFPDDYFFIEIWTYEGFALREAYFFNKIPFLTETTKVKGRPNLEYDGNIGGGYGTSVAGGDVAEDYYIATNSNDNVLTITHIDTVQNIIRGTFDVRFTLADKEEKVNPNNPDRVRLSDGEFEVKIIN